MMNLKQKNNNLIKTGYIIHFGEIALKGKNRKEFENKLIENLRLKIGNFEYIYEYGKLIILSEKNLTDILNSTFGIANWSKCYIIPIDEMNLTNNLLETIINLAKSKINFEEINNFKVETKRSNKKFQPNSIEINKILASNLIKLYHHLKVNLSNPERTIFLEIGNKNIYLYFSKNKGLGGLPVSSSGKVISLLSGGIDSPVASWLIMKRGAYNIFLHGYTKKLDNNEKNKNKIISLVKKLTKYQGEAKIYFVDVSNITKQIIENIPPKRRMLIFKRCLVKFANIIAEKEKGLAICSGDSLAQVASQTLENINVIFSASKLPILTPLIGFDKIEITQIAKKIGTYEISILPSVDRCSKISHKHPITKGKPEVAKKLEEKINIYPLNYEIVIIKHHEHYDAIEN